MDHTTLTHHFPGKIHDPSSPSYTTTAHSYFAAFENELNPSLVFQPSCAQDVSDFIRTVTTHNASCPSDAQTKLAIKSGGHTTWAGSANITAGITVDLSALAGVHLSDDESTVTIGAGKRWGDVYRALEPHGLAIVGGRVSKVGVGGLTLGGGLSYFSAATGFVCDNVLRYGVVLANSTIVTASATENKDLFLALKGGSNNLGVVTSFTFPTFPQGKMWGGGLFYQSSAIPAIYKAFYDFAAAAEPDEKAHIITATSWSGGKETGVSNVYHASPAPYPTSPTPFSQIPDQIFGTLREDSLRGFAEEQSNFSQDGARHWYFTTSFKLNLQLRSDVRELFLSAVKGIEAVEGLMLSLVYQPMTVGMLRKSAERARNSLGLTERDGPMVVVLLNSVHADAADDEKVREAVLGLIE